MMNNAQAETFSAHENVQSRFIAGGALQELENIINEVFATRADRLNLIPLVSCGSISPRSPLID